MDLDFESHRQTAVSNVVAVEHNPSIREWILEKQVRPLVDATSLGSVIDNLDPVAAALSPYGDVSYSLDLNKPHAKGEPLNIVTNILLADIVDKEPLKLGLYTGTQVNGATFNGKYRNKLGLGDSIILHGAAQPCTLGLSSGSATFDLPIPIPSLSNPHIGSRLFFLNQERPWASHSLESHGIAAYLSFPTKTLLANIGIEATARQIHSLGDAGSDTVRSAAANPATKVAAVANLTSGPFSLAAEAAGKPGDSVFTKFLGSFKLSRNLFAPFSVDFSADAGYIHGNSTVLDHFFLGGPITPAGNTNSALYGFKLNSVGPKDGQDFIGAQSFYQGSATLSSWLPWASKSPLRIVGILNGAAGQLNTAKTVGENVSNLLSMSPSVAFATGVSYKTGPASFDLLYQQPLHAAPGDVVSQGVYLGVNLNYA